MGHPLRVLSWPADANRTGNPYNARLADGLRRLGVVVHEFAPGRIVRGRYDIWHAHWPDGALGKGGALRAIGGAGATLALASVARARGIGIVWTVHNLQAHRPIPAWIEDRFWWGWSRAVDASIHLSESALRAALDTFPALRRRPAFVIPHPHYRLDYPAPPTGKEARSELGLAQEARVIGFVGHIRAYKGVSDLVRAVRGMPDPDVVLIVAGRPESQSLEADLREAAAQDPRILLMLETVPAARIPRLLAAVDLVVLPYREVLNSGAALLALSFGRPVLVPDRGAMADLRDMVGAAWVRLLHGPVTPHALAEALATAQPAPPAPLHAFEPDRIAESTLDAYRVITAGGGPPR